MQEDTPTIGLKDFWVERLVEEAEQLMRVDEMDPKNWAKKTSK